MKMNSVGIDLSENPGGTLCPERICFYREIIIVLPLHCGWIESNNNIQSKKYCQSRARPPSGAAAEKPNKEINWISDGARIFWQIETRICARIRQQLRLCSLFLFRDVSVHTWPQGLTWQSSWVGHSSAWIHGSNCQSTAIVTLIVFSRLWP